MSFLPTGRITQAWHVATSPPSSRLSLRATMIHTHSIPYLQVCAPPRRQPPSTNRSRRPLSVMSSRPSSAHGGQRFAVETRDIRMRLRPTALHGVLALHHPPQRANKSETPNTTFGRGHAAIFGRCNGSEWVLRAGQAATRRCSSHSGSSKTGRRTVRRCKTATTRLCPGRTD